MMIRNPMADGPTGVSEDASPVVGEIRNPFKDRTMRSQFDAMLRVYDERHRDLVRFIDGKPVRHLGNSWATHFWWGFDNINPQRWDKASRATLGWACYRAGRAVAELIEKRNR